MTDLDEDELIGTIITEMSTTVAHSRVQWDRLMSELVPELKGMNLVVLHAVMHRGPVNATGLSARLDVDKATLSRQITKLRDVGLVRSDPSPQDGRIQMLTLTEKAQDLIAEARKKWVRVYRERFEGWSDEDLTRLRDGLHRFNSDTA